MQMSCTTFMVADDHKSNLWLF